MRLRRELLRPVELEREERLLRDEEDGFDRLGVLRLDVVFLDSLRLDALFLGTFRLGALVLGWLVFGALCFGALGCGALCFGVFGRATAARAWPAAVPRTAPRRPNTEPTRGDTRVLDSVLISALGAALNCDRLAAAPLLLRGVLVSRRGSVCKSRLVPRVLLTRKSSAVILRLPIRLRLSRRLSDAAIAAGLRTAGTGAISVFVSAATARPRKVPKRGDITRPRRTSAPRNPAFGVFTRGKKLRELLRRRLLRSVCVNRDRLLKNKFMPGP